MTWMASTRTSVILKVLFPDGALEGILRGMVRSTPTPEQLFALWMKRLVRRPPRSGEIA